MTISISLGNPLGAALRRVGGGRDESATPAQASLQRLAGTDEDAGRKGGGARTVLAALLNRLSVDGGPSQGGVAEAGVSGAANAAVPAAAGSGSDAAADGEAKPNLDALNRVLNHYAAQSAAATMPFVVLDP